MRFSRPVLAIATFGLGIALLCGACSQNAPAADSDPAPGSAPSIASQALDEPASSDDRSAPFDLATLTALIYWDERHLISAPPIPNQLRDLFDALVGSQDPRALPFLADLAAVPNPYRRLALDALRDRYARPFAQTPYDIASVFAAATPEDQPPGYAEFKRRLYATIVPAYETILDPALPHTIAPSEVVWGGVGVDGIPPLEAPRFLSPKDAEPWVRPDDTIVGVVLNGDARAYPIRIIAWHEMVNDTVGGVPISLAYCTLCGSAIVYDGRAGDALYRFGTSGLLYRSNKLMYDRATGTLWSQFGGAPVWGPLASLGLRLTVLPSVVTNWASWVGDHPDTVVLDINTGFTRDYSPGAAYADYNASPAPWFNSPLQDERLPEKAVVHVVQMDGEWVAYPLATLAERGLVHDRIRDVAVVVVGTPDGEGARAFATEGREFRTRDAGRTLIGPDDGVWTVTEDSLIGPSGARLARIAGNNSFWFAFVNLATGGRLYEVNSPAATQ